MCWKSSGGYSAWPQRRQGRNPPEEKQQASVKHSHPAQLVQSTGSVDAAPREDSRARPAREICNCTPRPQTILATREGCVMLRGVSYTGPEQDIMNLDFFL